MVSRKLWRPLLVYRLMDMHMGWLAARFAPSFMTWLVDSNVFAAYWDEFLQSTT